MTITKTEFIEAARKGWVNMGICYGAYFYPSRKPTEVCAIGAAARGMGLYGIDGVRKVCGALGDFDSDVAVASDLSQTKKAALAAIEALDWPERLK